MAISGGYNEVIELLIKAGASPRIAGWKKSTALSLAAEKGDLALLAELIRKGADTTADSVAMVAAAASGHEQGLAILLDNGANVNAVSRAGSALQAAAYNGHIECVRFFLAKGADVNLGRWSSRQGHGVPLQAAAATGNLEIFEMLLENDGLVLTSSLLEGALKDGYRSNHHDMVHLLSTDIAPGRRG